MATKKEEKSEKIELLEFHELEALLEDNKENEEQASDPSEERESSPSKDKSPWKTVIHQPTSEELRPSQMEFDELREEMSGVLNETIGVQQCEVSSNSFFSKLIILKEENKALREELKVIHKELENMRHEMVLLRKTLAHDGRATTSVSIPISSSVETSKPKSYIRNANDVHNFLWSLE
ncbi:hypothetical protein V6N11_059166 [Hibiscus sabdariffa]|uniref:Uncharacterized protein n=1 Tax=Hibiscus sabdariffa TaxID=183260 RepID=A0ABR2U6N7_9ROSI